MRTIITTITNTVVMESKPKRAHQPHLASRAAAAPLLLRL
jgi:hypothetical protein